MEFKVVISDPQTQTYQKVVSGANANKIIGKKVGDNINGTLVELPPDYELVITGGSDKDGIPIRPDVAGSGRKKILVGGGVGFNPKRKGLKRKKTVRGNTVSRDVVQLNVKVIQQGKVPLTEFFKEKEE
ncbi:MAG: 30S ribosomal protein S6e [Archaeoglobaceae archaeon]